MAFIKRITLVFAFFASLTAVAATDIEKAEVKVDFNKEIEATAVEQHELAQSVSEKTAAALPEDPSKPRQIVEIPF